MSSITIFTIGFTKKNARTFFETLRAEGVRRIIDVRLNNTSQLAGFTRRDDLAYFLSAILGVNYAHHPELAPTREIMEGYKKHGQDWSRYEEQFRRLLESRKAEIRLKREDLDSACLLCSEDKPLHCHRRLVAEYLKEKWGGVEIRHIL